MDREKKRTRFHNYTSFFPTSSPATTTTTTDEKRKTKCASLRTWFEIIMNDWRLNLVEVLES